MINYTWTPTSRQLPPNGVTVMTKIDDRNGVRNEQLMTLTGSLWFSGGMYVYYEPTHWKNI